MYNGLNEAILFNEIERQRERLQVRRYSEPRVRRWLHRAA